MTLSSLQTLSQTSEGREQIRVMVAELRGARWYRSGGSLTYLFPDAPPNPLFRKVERPAEITKQHLQHVARYTTSLDAMAEARKSLNIDEEYTYGEWMRKLCGCTGPRGGLFTPNGFGIYAVSNADATKHAIAYILTKTKGDDRE